LPPAHRKLLWPKIFAVLLDFVSGKALLQGLDDLDGETYRICAETPSVPDSHSAHAACDDRLQGRRSEATREASGERERSGRGPHHRLAAPSAPWLLSP